MFFDPDNSETSENDILKKEDNKKPKKKKTKLNKCCKLGPLTPVQSSNKAYKIRKNAADFQRNLPIPVQRCNADETEYPNKIANFSKVMPHNKLGEVDLSAYNMWIKALTTGNSLMFEEIPLGGKRKFVSPQAAYAFDLEGPNSQHLTIPPAPRFKSAQAGSEMVEDYWRALTRDVPFTDYDTDVLTRAAAIEISEISGYQGPKRCGKVDTGILFRGSTKGDLKGPFLSQFLWKDIPAGAKTIDQRIRTTVQGIDYMTSYEDWLYIQNGGEADAGEYDPKLRYIRSGRDLAEWVHNDYSFQTVLNAGLIALGFGDEAICTQNPYLSSTTQEGFTTFGVPHVLDFVTKAARIALEAAWFQKFLVHRRLRPEEYGGRVHNHITGDADYPIHQDLLDSEAVDRVYKEYGTYLLPMAYPEGCPAHPAYPAGHASIAGAGVTMLKAFFNEDYIIPKPVVSSADGLSLLPYEGKSLTIGDELNKLGSNISHGRDTAGVHYRSDGFEGLKLGEAVALGILHDFKKTYNEEFEGFYLTKFDGTTVII